MVCAIRTGFIVLLIAVKQIAGASFSWSEGQTEIVEHWVSGQEAEEFIKTMVRPSSKGELKPGCKECNYEEMHYCTTEGVIRDHCCCDRKFNEVFPYVEHICNFRPLDCPLIVRDCEEYARLRKCCCDQVIAAKYTALSNSSVRDSQFTFGTILLPIIWQLL